jgi:hypothetical protein
MFFDPHTEHFKASATSETGNSSGGASTRMRASCRQSFSRLDHADAAIAHPPERRGAYGRS